MAKKAPDGRLTRLEQAVDRIERRVFNGLGQELRQEVKGELSALRNLVIGLLVSLIIATVTSVVIQGRVSAAKSSSENDRNYQAIMRLDDKLQDHMNGR